MGSGRVSTGKPGGPFLEETRVEGDVTMNVQALHHLVNALPADVPAREVVAEIGRLCDRVGVGADRRRELLRRAVEIHRESRGVLGLAVLRPRRRRRPSV